VKDETLVKLLRKRTLLGALPPKAIRALLRAEGDPKEVARLADLAHLASL